MTGRAVKYCWYEQRRELLGCISGTACVGGSRQDIEARSEQGPSHDKIAPAAGVDICDGDAWIELEGVGEARDKVRGARGRRRGRQLGGYLFAS